METFNARVMILWILRRLPTTGLISVIAPTLLVDGRTWRHHASDRLSPDGPLGQACSGYVDDARFLHAALFVDHETTPPLSGPKGDPATHISGKAHIVKTATDPFTFLIHDECASPSLRAEGNPVLDTLGLAHLVELAAHFIAFFIDDKLRLRSECP